MVQDFEDNQKRWFGSNSNVATKEEIEEKRKVSENFIPRIEKLENQKIIV
jgi:hypothetical protein